MSKRKGVEVGERLSFGEVKDPFGPTAWADTDRILMDHEMSRRRVNEVLNIGSNLIKIRVAGGDALRVLHFSDWHMFDDASNPEFVERAMAELRQPGTVAVLYGDMINGLMANNIGIAARQAYDFDSQIRIFRERIVKPAAAEGLIVAMVHGYDGHEEWARRVLTLRAIRMMADGVYLPDGSPLQLLNQSGRIEFDFENGTKHVIKAYHDPGGGGSDEISPVGAQMKRDVEVSLDSTEGHNAVVGGHWHHRKAVAEIAYWRGDTSQTQVQVLIANGTGKGAWSTGDDEYVQPDEYSMANAKGESARGGTATILTPVKGDLRVWPTLGQKKVELVDRAMRALDLTESKGLTNELIDEAMAKTGEPTYEFMSSKRPAPEVSDRPHFKSKVRNAPLFRLMDWKITSEWPTAVVEENAPRFGSTSTKEGYIGETVQMVVDDPTMVMLGMRHVIDNDVHRRYDRVKVLNTMADTFRPVHEKGRLLGLMLSDSLRRDGWKSMVRADGAEYPGISTGDYLYFKSPLKGVPLYQNKTRFEFRINNGGGVMYTALVMDKLDRSGSSLDPFIGLKRARDYSRLAYDVVTGGNMRGVGVLDTEDTVLIAPGWDAEYDSRGKGNRERVPDGANGWEMMAREKIILGAPTRRDLFDRHKALKVLTAMRISEVTMDDLGARSRKTKKKK